VSRKLLRIGTVTPISNLDPRIAHDFTGHVVISQVFETPYRHGPSGPLPVLVEGPFRPVAAGSPRLAARLRAGLLFSDGTPVRASDLAAAATRAGLDDSYTIEAVDDRLEVTPRRPGVDPPEHTLTERVAGVVREVGAAVLGTGPFRVAQHDEHHVVLERNAHARRQARVDGLEVRCYHATRDGHPEALLAAVRAGEVDFTQSLGRDDVTELEGVRKLFQPGMSTAILSFNTQRPHFATAEVRRATAAAVDRWSLAGLCYESGAAYIAKALLPPALAGAAEGRRYDPAKPRDAPAAAALPPTLHLVRVWGPRPYLPRPDSVAEEIARNLVRLGTRVEVTTAVDSEDYSRLLRDGDYDLVLGGWVADTMDPVDYLRSTLGSDQIPVPGKSPASAGNYARLRDPQVDAWLREARRDPTAIERILAYVASEVMVLPLLVGPRVIVHSWRVRDFDPEAGVFPDFSAVDLAPEPPPGLLSPRASTRPRTPTGA
jgi:ABC-type transport system substrate-binding protein